MNAGSLLNAGVSRPVF